MSTDDTGDEKPLPRIEGSETVGSTKWIELKTLTYRDQTGTERKWDYATRTTKASGDSADAVVIVPLLKHASSSGGDSTLDTLLVEPRWNSRRD